MREQKPIIRDMVIPDIQVKILKLCLGEDENGIVTSRAPSKIPIETHRTDIALKEIISRKIREHEENISLDLKKKAIYDVSANDIFNDKLNMLFPSDVVPITMRKHLLYVRTRAG